MAKRITRDVEITICKKDNSVIVDGTRIYGIDLVAMGFILAEYDQNYWQCGDLIEVRTNRSVKRLIKRLIDASR
jgi:hypothetical protein